MKKNYGFLDDDEKLNENSESIRYREYKKNIRNIQINFEQILSEFKESLNYYENDSPKQKDHYIHEFLLNNKKKIEGLENLHKNGIQNLDIMKNYFSHNSTYAIEIARYLSIFDKFKIQLQNVKNTYDKICLHNSNSNKNSNNNIYKKKEFSSRFTNNNDIDQVFKERYALEYSISELGNIISVGQETNVKLKMQNYNVMHQLKKINFINNYLPQIQRILKNIKNYNMKKTIILSVIIALCIFVFFMIR
ncbi:hypothetical protein MKS88_004404 [Plasmodium brasilianum]|uniref:SNARE protein n=2 Tax=Plasmodium (Plasmodium) TaxID=418103 RepID=A0A1A8W9D6_PLAMA|nr:conserved Plasmodium protein, unknown function [Plasmodium malariae]KAI4836605.1 hypothetical protein MKS88_004404 [Plasmodium brasilianum]SBS88315.1 conserved Plasmodium protein, unknown function [Plasmodium malariae]SCO93881.1 conserved Plasmodium protein, unknown function [Plasmodium malariae]